MSSPESSQKNLRIVGVIPARFASTRFPGKPLALIKGRPLLAWTIAGAKQALRLSSVIVATDDARIAELAESCGVKAAMTSPDLPTGTDRVCAALSALPGGYEVAINIQGDEPLITGAALDALAEPFFSDDALEMATLGRALDADALRSPNTAKIVLNERGEAIYFSRFPIPFSRLQQEAGAKAGQGISPKLALKHIGLYAYRKAFLERFCAAGPCPLENAESLEQLRALYLGARIKTVLVESDSWGVDTPDDVRKIENIIDRDGRFSGPREPL